ncbi:MAG: ISL3 family transposase, partial [bacterium]|nr:ISL3 family transposase [bacterium]
MANNIAKIFSLQGLYVELITTTDTTIILGAKGRRLTAECTKCGRRSRQVHQYHRRQVTHDYLHDKLVLVRLTVRRFKCRSCNKPFTEALLGIGRRLSTNHCLTHQLEDAAGASIKSTAERHGKAWASIASLLDDIRWEIPWQKQGKRISLGIDEHSLRKRRQMVTTVTNLTKGQKTVLTILPNDRKDTIMKFLNQVPKDAQGRITEICIDLRASFRSAIEEAWPQVNIVADPFHVVQLAGRAVEDVRSTVLGNMGRETPRVKRALLTPKEKLSEEYQDRLNKLWQTIQSWPHLKIAWQVKEKIRDLYRSRNRESAEKKFQLILVYLEGVESKPLVVLRGTLIRWQDQILNHFDHGTSNGFTEGCHTKIKML